MTDLPSSLRRWRLVLGRFADGGLSGGLSRADQRIDQALDHVYGQGYTRRGLRLGGAKGRGSRAPSQLTTPKWLNELRALFPREVYETIQGHALERYGMTDILNDAKVLEEIRPDATLLGALLAFRGRADAAMQEKIRAVARRTVEDMIRRIKPRFDRALSGARRRQARSLRKSMADFDWRGTLRANLKNWDRDRRVLIAERLRFTGRTRRRLPWTVILCVDQSGSMFASVVYSAVVAAIFNDLPGVTVKLVVFDTSVVDLSGRVADPVSVLMSVQLGGGTDIAQAVTYCTRYAAQPTRTIFALVSDFCEGGPPGPLIAAVRRLAEARVTLLGLAALDDEGRPDFDRDMAQKLASAGMNVAALTPERFAEWIAGVIG